MATDLVPFNSITADLVETARGRLRGFVAAYRPDVDARGGLIGNLVIELLSVSLAAVDQRIDQFRLEGSLLQAAEDPDAFDADTLDALLSNFRLARSAGRKATGTVSLVVRSLVPVSVPAGFSFLGGSGTFVTATAFAGRVSSDQVVASTDRLLVPTGDGRYAFSIEVEATTEGPVGLISRGTAVIPQASIAGVVEAYAADDFVGGLDQETNAQLVQRALAGVSGRGPANRIGVVALLTQDTTVGALLSAVSVVGFGDEEQTRYHGLRPVAYGGRCDVYLRPAGGPTDQTTEVTAVQSGTSDGLPVWTVTLPTTQYGGAYGVVRVANSSDPTAAELTILNVTPGWTPNPYVDVETAAEAAYSALQTGRVDFSDPDDATATTPYPATRQVFVTVRRAVGVSESHALIQRDDTRPTAGDILVRAAVPCTVRFVVVVATPSGKAVDTVAASAAVSAAVERSGFTGRLPVSRLVAAVNGAVGDDQEVVDWSIEGVIDSPDGTRLTIGSKQGLEIPWRPDLGVTFRTTAFYLSAEDLAFETRGVEA